MNPCILWRDQGCREIDIVIEESSRAARDDDEARRSRGIVQCVTANERDRRDTGADRIVEAILALSSTWFQRRDDVLGLMLVGSHARGAARPGSDIDLVILTKTPQAYRDDEAWPMLLPWSEIGASVTSFRDQDYGALWSRHVFSSSNQEIEYGFASADWLSVDPIDPGTYQVLRAGHRILYDPLELLRSLSEHVRARAAG